MKERVGQTLGRKEARGLMVSTFHTLGLDIIRREQQELESQGELLPVRRSDQLALLKELTEAELDNDKDKLSGASHSTQIFQLEERPYSACLRAASAHSPAGPREVLIAQAL
ncbi:UvrD-helicase domain-containing protein [Escherichia coli]